MDQAFGKNVDAYYKFRPSYPLELFTEILSNLNGAHKKAADLGAGTGLSTAFLCNYFENIYVIEPDSKMIEQLKKAGYKNCLFYSQLAEEVKLQQADIDLVTSGNAFYWMNGEAVVSKVYNWLREDGVFALYRYEMPTTKDNEINEIIAKEDKEWDEYRHERLRDTSYSYRVVKNSGLFKNIKVMNISNMVDLTANELVGFFSSTSYFFRNI